MLGKKKTADYSANTSGGNTECLTVITEGTTVSGSVSVSGSMRLDGSIEGDVSCHGMFVVGVRGSVKGDITGKSAVLYGSVEGDISVSETLVLKSGCKVQGNVCTCKLEIEPQARFNGVCTTTEGDSSAPAEAFSGEDADRSSAPSRPES